MGELIKQQTDFSEKRNTLDKDRQRQTGRFEGGNRWELTERRRLMKTEKKGLKTEVRRLRERHTQKKRHMGR